MSTAPVTDPDTQRLGRALYKDLAACLSSHVDFFGEGFPGEWLLALEALHGQLNKAKRRAKAASDAQQKDHESQQGVLL